MSTCDQPDLETIWYWSIMPWKIRGHWSITSGQFSLFLGKEIGNIEKFMVACLYIHKTFLDFFSLCYCVSHTFPWGVLESPWAQRGPRSGTRDLWCRWWVGPSDPSVGGGPGRLERLPPMETRKHKGKAMSYA